jgi:TatD DNase family protein
MTSGLIDFHCHVDLFPDPAAAVREAEAQEVYTLAVTTTPKAWPRNDEWTRSTRFVRAGLGLHPELVAERASEISLWEEYLPQTRYVGEVGVDGGPRCFKSLRLQSEIFARILKSCAAAGGKILSVHSFRAVEVVLDLIEDALPERPGQFVLHWFTGSNSEARRAVDLGCFFSVNTAMLSKERGRRLIASLPLDRLLTETDAPFTSVAGRPARPADVTDALDALANLRGLSRPQMARTVHDNLKTALNR